ncbi:I78 family peptidase inhibitor [Croceicoccus sp. BE223]|uniref:I78 family peptidase inhibitor n=1 Tax=Croceicoccus sp. BE223 TaxID=2817716 RepID=UPI002854455E|nr:I78 family peptidase inhibitor [Croceicoccus sp. BE223]MDR7101960.1 hypothetical protein [Croceicoccus sp. BE223]
MNRLIILVAAPLALSGCATTATAPSDPVVSEPEGTCDARAAQVWVGKMATTDMGAELLASTGSRTLRWIPPRTAVTMDYRPDRVSVSYDDNMIITQISCG